MEKGCKTDPAIKALSDSDKEKFEDICHSIRTDQAYTDTGENDNLIVQKLSTNPDAVGIFSYSYLADNADTVRGVPIGGLLLSSEAPWRGRRITRTSWQKYFPPNCAPIPMRCEIS